MKKFPLSTHILDLHKGTPAAGVSVELYAPNSNTAICSNKTNDDGRILEWSNEFKLISGVWRLKFNVAEWFKKNNRNSFFADIELAFNIDESQAHYHVPLLLNEFGYSSYKGS